MTKFQKIPAMHPASHNAGFQLADATQPRLWNLGFRDLRFFWDLGFWDLEFTHQRQTKSQIY
jgi:hypothetical protein